MNDHRPCDVCGQAATIINSVTGLNLCDNPVCYGTAWDQAFEVNEFPPPLSGSERSTCDNETSPNGASTPPGSDHLPELAERG